MEQHKYLSQTKAWIKELVIGQQLCPFAKAVWDQQRIRFVLYPGQTRRGLYDLLRAELDFLQEQAPEQVDTTILVHPLVLQDFYDYLDFVAEAEALLVDLELEGVFQLASFHPNYQFAGTLPTAAENYTNRSPYPMLHLLREKSVSRAIAKFPDPASIPEKNIARMNEIGATQLKQILHELKR